jgi:GTP-binding protein
MAAFIDEALVHVKAGDGGDGAVAWHREPYVPNGGPAGGDGGDGGDVILEADENISTLLDYKYKPHLRAPDGEKGKTKNMFGRGGEDIVARLPVGTQAVDAETGEVICDLTEHGERQVVCKGGSGGHGNARFATASRQAPDFAKPGLPGEERDVRLVLKLMADVGLLGYPNAGKSTFLSKVSAARPKIADYPFTTLVPQLGVVQVDDGHSFVLADIPGLIEGAADGAGLGTQFLKHLERVRVLLHLVEPPLPGTDPEDTSRLLVRYRQLRTELDQYGHDLASLPEVVAVTKKDIIRTDDPEVSAFLEAMERAGTHVHMVSSATGEGVEELVRAVYRVVRPTLEKREPYDPLKRAR